MSRIEGVARVAITATAIGAIVHADHGSAQIPLPDLYGVIEDTADRDSPGCDVAHVGAIGDRSIAPFIGQFDVSHGRADAQIARKETDRIVYNELLGRMNSSSDHWTSVVITNDRNGISATEHRMGIPGKKAPYAGAVAVLRAKGEQPGSVYLAATMNSDDYDRYISADPTVRNPCAKTGYELSIVTHNIDDQTGVNSLEVAGPNAVLDTGSLLISRIIYDEAGEEVMALGYDKSGESCNSGVHLLRYKVIESNGQYSLEEISRLEINAKRDPYTDVDDERVGNITQLDYDTVAYTTGLNEIVLINRETGIQTSTPINFGREIRSIAIDPQTGFLLIVDATHAYTARLESGRIVVFDMIPNPSPDASREIGGTADSFLRNGVGMMPTNEGRNDLREIRVDPTGRIVSNEGIAVCVDKDNQEANIVSSLVYLQGQNVFQEPTPLPTVTSTHTPLPTWTSTSSPTWTPTPSSTPTFTMTPYPFSSPTRPIIEETPTRKAPTSTNEAPKPTSTRKRPIPSATPISMEPRMLYLPYLARKR